MKSTGKQRATTVKEQREPSQSTTKRRRLLSPLLRPIGVQVRRLRLERGLSQERLAELSDLINYKHIGSIELSKVEPCAEVLIRLARGLKVPVGELFDTITPMHSHGYRLSPADVEAISASLKNLTTIFDRVRAGQPPPVPRRAPRRSHR